MVGKKSFKDTVRYPILKSTTLHGKKILIVFEMLNQIISRRPPNKHSHTPA